MLNEIDRGGALRRDDVAGGGERAVHRDDRVLAALDQSLHLPRALARDRHALGAAAQAAHLRTDRRHRGGADLQPARAHRRTAQLGLPLHLAARRGVHAVRPHAHRVHRGGRALHELARGALPRDRADGALQIMYGIDGRHELTEEVLDHLEGYRGSSPVRIGNGAYRQLQLDIYGELMDSVYLYNKYGVADLVRHVVRPAPPGRLGVRELGPPRRRDLGGARRPAAASSSRS